MNNNKSKGFGDVAIVGMGALFAGASNVQEFWENIVGKVDSIQDVPKNFWDLDEFYDKNPLAEDKTYCKRGGFLPPVNFDPLEFGIPPKVLESISLNQLLSLKVAKDCLIDAGMLGDNKFSYDKQRVGVVLGANMGGNAFPLRERLMSPAKMKIALQACDVSNDVIENVIAKMKDGYVPWTEDSFPGFLSNIVSGRIVNRFDFGGANYVVDAACASSHCAIMQSIQELDSGRCDVMLTGGVNVSNDPLSFVSFSKTPALSLSNEIRPYDKNADGMLLGDGIGMLVLMRLEDAKQKNCKIYSVIKAIGTSSDGKAKSIYAPLVEGQISALSRAYESSGILTRNIGLIEGHGTGTPVGDACEVEGLKSFFSQYDLPNETIALGSVKSQIGHTTQAAGVASTIKAVLALHHKVIPPTINVEEVNPEFRLPQSPFYVCKDAKPWISPKSDKRAAAVSSFGFGGVNYHLILEEYQHEHGSGTELDEDPDEALGGYRINRLPTQVILSGQNRVLLVETCERLIAELGMVGNAGQEGQKNSGEKEDLDKLLAPYRCRDLTVSDMRLGFVCFDAADTLKKVTLALNSLLKNDAKQWQLPQGICFREQGLADKAKVAVLFTGQGSQYPEMGTELAQNFPEIRRAFCQVDAALAQFDKPGVSEWVYGNDKSGESESRVFSQTDRVQPALAAFCSGLFTVLGNRGFKPDFVAGHSFGELTALWAASAISLEDYYKLSIVRGVAMQNSGVNNDESSSNDSGSMLAVNASEEDVRLLLGEFDSVNMANINSTAQVVVSGCSAQIDSLARVLSTNGIRSIKLDVSGAFHSKYMATALKEFGSYVDKLVVAKPSYPVYSNETAMPYPDGENDIKSMLSRHLEKPVAFKKTIENMVKDGARIFVEIGPKGILSNFVKDTLQVVQREGGDPNVPDYEVISLNPNHKKDSVTQYTEAMMQLEVAGIHLKRDVHGLIPNLQLNQTSSESSSLSKKKLNVVLHGRQYLTDETLLKMKTISDVKFSGRSNDTSDSEFQVNAPKKQNSSVSDVHYASENASKNVSRDLGSDVSRDVSSIIGHQQTNSLLQSQFLEMQSSHLSLLDRMIGQQSVVVDKLDDTTEISVLSRRHADTLDALFRCHQSSYDVQTQFLESQNKILSQINGDYGEINGSISKQINRNITASYDSSENTPNRNNNSRNHKSSQKNNLKNTTPVIDTASAIETTNSITKKTNVTDQAYEAIAPNNQAEIASSIEKQQEFVTSLLAIVTEITGYPSDILDMDMDLESDLGIDSIKRVEIFSSLHERYSDISSDVDLSVLAELSSLQEIVEFFVGSIKPNASQVVESIDESSDKKSNFLDVLLSIVSEITGYPKDILDLDMDLEADLGIDSIKRVEIFSALNDHYQDAASEPEDVNLSELAALSTLSEIVEFFSKDESNNEQKDDENIYPNATMLSDIGDDHSTVDLDVSERYVVSVDDISMPQLSFFGNNYDDFGEKVTERLDAFVREGMQIIITDSGDGVGERLNERFKTFGAKTTLIHLYSGDENKQHKMRDTDNELTINTGSISDASVLAILNSIVEKNGPIGGLIHINPLLEEKSDIHEYFCDDEKSLIRTVYFIVKHMKLALIESQQKAKAFVSIVTRIDGKMGMNGVLPRSIIQGGYYGLAKSLRLEAPNLYCRCIDIAPGMSSDDVENVILDEVFDTESHPIEVGRVLPNRRVTIVKQTSDINDRSNSEGLSQVCPSKDDVFLVPGGARGVTARCIEGLAEHYGCKFILVGRTSIDEAEPEWSKHCKDEVALQRAYIEEVKRSGKTPTPAMIDEGISGILSRREVEATMMEIKSVGGSVIYISQDLTSTDGLVEKIESATKEFGAVTGVIHGAGNLADKNIENKTEADYDLVYDTKVSSLYEIIKCIDVSKLKYMILFSSISGYFGQIGQTDYSLSNEILNKFAHALEKVNADIVVKSINWGPWDGGMVTPGLKKLYKSFNLEVIPVQEGVNSFVKELIHKEKGSPQILVCQKDIDSIRNNARELMS